MTYDPKSHRSMITIAAIGAGFALVGGCRRNAASEQDRVEAEQIESRAEHEAGRLRDQARAIESSARENGHAEADRMRERAEQIRVEARREASTVEHNAEDTMSDRSGAIPAQGQGGGPVIAAHIALARETYAAARCDREVRCNRIGEGRRHASREACLQTARTDRNDSWDAADCQSNGINQNELDECLNAVRNEDCNNPIEALQRLTACRAGEVCRH